ncbi:MAG TPA: SH3 domain-containing protein [Terriglobia bacterium]|nr:SH3 domain-containing protein [Terriglobia bacterium]
MAYVGGAKAELRDQLGPATKVIGYLQSGARVRILSRRPRWAEVRAPDGATGWVLQRHLVSQAVFDQFAALAREAAELPSQGQAVIRRRANLHLRPGREEAVFYQLTEGELVDVVGHQVAPRHAEPENPPGQETSSADALANRPAATPEDWLLVRASRNRTGWLLEASADLNPPLEVAQYREGLPLRAWFVIHREIDQGVERPWYLWATIRRRAGWPYDFDEIRVFVWNPRAGRYETSYRERNLKGFYPIRVGRRDTAQGSAPAFQLELENDRGERFQKNYFMVGRQVRVER